MSFVWTLFIPIAKYYIFQILRKPAPVLKPGDWEKSSNGRQWKPQLGFNRDRRPVHLDPSAFRTLGWVVAFYLCIFAFSESSQSIKPAFMPQIFETIKYYYFVGILMTSIFFCFFFFFFLIHFSLVYYCFVLLENSNIFSLRDFAILLTSYFKRIRLFSTLRKMLAKLTSGRGSV